MAAVADQQHTIWYVVVPFPDRASAESARDQIGEATVYVASVVADTFPGGAKIPPPADPQRTVDELLAELREARDAFLNAADSTDEQADAGAQLAARFTALDELLSSGGQPPDEWTTQPEIRVGEPFPGRPGYVTGECGHAVAGSEWRAGFRWCEHCPSFSLGHEDDLDEARRPGSRDRA